MEAIILDGNQRAALAVTRSLGKRGVKTTSGAETGPSLAACSKYCSRSFLYPSPDTNPDGFLSSIRKRTACKPGAVLFPMTDITLGEILMNRDAFGDHAKIPFVDYGKYISVSDKTTLFSMAKGLDIPIPKTLFSSEYNDGGQFMEEAGRLGFPLVIKPARSRIRTGDGWVGTRVRYAKDMPALHALLNDEPFKSFPFLIQERITGPGIGIFLLMREGKVLARFAHRRIREKPPSGGVSVLCESIAPPPVALDAAVALLEKLCWFGVAMVEFKEDTRDGIPKLMEVNARFWGSLQLAISAGVNFPCLLYRLALGEQISRPPEYRVGLRSRWELGDLDNFLIMLTKRRSRLLLPPSAPSRVKVCKDFIADFYKASVKNEIMDPDDPMPFLFELKQYAKNIFLRGEKC